MDIHKQKNESRHRSLKTVNSKWIIDLHIKCKTLEDEKADTPVDIFRGVFYGFLHLTAKAQFMKAKPELEFIKV